MKFGKFKFISLFVLSIFLIVTMTACNNNGIGDTNPNTYNLEVIIEGVVNVDHAEIFSVSSNGGPGVDQFKYEDNNLIAEITGLSGTTELTLITNNNSLTDGEYTSDNKVIEVNSTNSKAKFEVTFLEKEADSIDSTEMILVEAGTTSVDNGSITVNNDFYIGKYHVTQAYFKDVMGFNPSGINDADHPNLVGNSDNRPVEQVTWYDAVKFCNQLSEIEGLVKYYNISDIEYNGNNIKSARVEENIEANGYRLPTADEHQYAARGGKDGDPTTYSGNDNLDEVSWYFENSDAANSSETNPLKGGTMPVGEKEANELGLFDMSGNVWDWTNTSLDSSKIFRGGSWYNYPYGCVVDFDGLYSKSSRRNILGFRLAKSK